MHNIVGKVGEFYITIRPDVGVLPSAFEKGYEVSDFIVHKTVAKRLVFCLSFEIQ